VRPERYDLRVAVEPDEGRFGGRVRIAVRLAEAAREMTLHAQELEIGEVQVESAGGACDAAVRLDPTATTLTLFCPRDLAGPRCSTLRFPNAQPPMKGSTRRARRARA
jgi:hypothetical protein